MNANTVYDIFLALSENERQNLIVKVNEYQNAENNAVLDKIGKLKTKSKFTKKEAIDYLLKTVFVSKK